MREITDFVRIRPRCGLLVPYEPPHRGFVPPDGCDVVWCPWWARRLRDGDVEIVTVDPPPVEKLSKPKTEE